MTTAIENVRVFDGSVVSEPRRVVFGETVSGGGADAAVDGADTWSTARTPWWTAPARCCCRV